MPKRPSHGDRVEHKRRLLEHSESYYEAQKMLHGESHIKTVNALYDLFSKRADHSNAVWKHLVSEANASKDPAVRKGMEPRIRKAEKEFEDFTVQMKVLQKKFGKNK